MNTEGTIKLYQEVLDLSKRNLQSVNPNNLKGYFMDVNGNEEEFIKRLTIVAYHATHHMAQMLRFHGLMCESLQNADLLIETT